MEFVLKNKESGKEKCWLKELFLLFLFFFLLLLKTFSDFYSCTRGAVDGLFGEGTVAFLPKASYGTTWR